MVEFEDRGRLVAVDDIDDLVFLELLFHSLHDFQHKLDLLGRIHFGFRMVAIVAVVAILLLVVLTEVMEQVFAAAVGGFGVCRGLREQLFDDLLFGDRLLGGEFFEFVQILGVVEGDAKSFAVVTAGASGLLVVAFETLGHVVVDHEAHVRFVDAHAEGDGGHDDLGFLHQEVILVLDACFGVEAGVVG